MANLYTEAATWGQQQALGEAEGGPVSFERVLYWTAWWAARRAADAVLVEALRVGVSPEHWEALRKVAAEVAYD